MIQPTPFRIISLTALLTAALGCPGSLQDPARFSDLMTALFSAGSDRALRLVSEGRCVFEFEQYTQGYRVPCAVSRLAATTAFYEATLWHNRMFNPRLPPDPEILAFRPDWPHARGFRLAE